jgi:hypothetical protein
MLQIDPTGELIDESTFVWVDGQNRYVSTVVSVIEGATDTSYGQIEFVYTIQCATEKKEDAG